MKARRVQRDDVAKDTSRLQEELEHLHRVTQGIEDVLYSVGGRSEITFIGGACRQMLGRSPESLIGRPVGEVALLAGASRDSLDALRRTHDEAVRNRETTLRCEFPVTRAGSSGRVELREQIHYDRIGKATGTTGLLRDVTDRWRAEEALRESEETHRNLVEQANDGVVIVQDDIVAYVNPALARVLRRTPTEILGTDFARHVHPDDVARLSDRYRCRLAGEDVLPVYEASLLARDGTRVHVELNASLITFRGNPADLVIIRDITERRIADGRRESLIAAEREQRLLAETLGEVSLALTSRTTLAAVLDEILSQARRIVPFKAANIALLQRGTLHIARALGYEPFGLECAVSNLTQPLDGFLLDAQAINSRDAVVVRDAREDPRWVTVPETAWIRAYIAIPICLQDQALGLLRLDGDEPGAFTEEDARRLMPLASAAAVALENARLHETAQRELAERSEAEEALRRSDAHLRGVLAAATNVAFVTTDASSGLVLDFSPGAERIFGYRSDEVIGKPETILHPPEDQIEGSEPLPSLRRNKDGFSGESTLVRKSGERFPALLTTHPLFDQERELVRSLSVSIDLSEKKAAEEALQESKRKIEGLHEATRQLAACTTEDQVCQLTVISAEEILDFSLCTLDLVEGDRLAVKATSRELPLGASTESPLQEGLAGKTYFTGKTRIFGTLGEAPEAKPTREEFQSGISAPIGSLGVFQVASTKQNAFTSEDARLLELLLGHTTEALKRIRLQRELKEQAILDPLTSVYNRRYFGEVIEQEISRSRRYAHPVALVMIDVDRLKDINDRFGHQAGDRVLQEVAQLLRGAVRETDIVIRYGGDEFLIVLPETDGEAEVVAARIRKAIRRRNEESLFLPDHSPVTLAVGIGHWDPGSPRSLETLLAEVDQRMYENKRGQRPRP